jgi:hypothetical protein
MASDLGFTYALINELGEVRPVPSQTPAWLVSFARHHRVALTHIECEGIVVSTVFLGCGQLDGEKVIGAFETIMHNGSRWFGGRRTDTLAAAAAYHELSVDAFAPPHGKVVKWR